MQNVPPSLMSTYEMLQKAYGRRIPDAYLESVVAALSPGMNFRTLTATLNYFHEDLCSIEQLYYKYMVNDKLCLPVAEFKASPDHARVLTHLKTYGYDAWLAENEIL